MDKLGALPNCYCKMGAVEEWGVEVSNPRLILT